MPAFSFHEPWCACGKPMALACSSSLEGYFTDISSRGAVFAHRKHLQMQIKSDPIKISTPLDGAVLTITFEYGVIRLHPIKPNYNVHAVTRDDTPMPDTLSSYQAGLLEAEEWDTFWSGLCTKELCDVIVYQSDTMIARVLLSLKGNVIASQQINIGGKVYIDDTMVGNCSWTRETSIECKFAAASSSPFAVTHSDCHV